MESYLQGVVDGCFSAGHMMQHAGVAVSGRLLCCSPAHPRLVVKALFWQGCMVDLPGITTHDLNHRPCQARMSPSVQQQQQQHDASSSICAGWSTQKLSCATAFFICA
jgi:hypothetical protein